MRDAEGRCINGKGPLACERHYQTGLPDAGLKSAGCRKLYSWQDAAVEQLVRQTLLATYGGLDRWQRQNTRGATARLTHVSRQPVEGVETDILALPITISHP